MTIQKTFRTLIFLLVLALPQFSFAATASSTASVDVAALSSRLTKPKLYGTADDTKVIYLDIYKASSTKAVYKSKAIKVKKDEWKTVVTKKIPNGTYTVKIYGEKRTPGRLLSTQTLVIDTTKKTANVKTDTKFDTNVVVESIPLLAGGIAHANQNIPVAYLQVTNVGKEASTLKGFWLKQNGSASAQSIIGLSSVDETGTLRASVGGTEGKTPFTDNVAFVPTVETIIQPGQMKLFTIKANVSGNVDSYLGKQIVLGVTSVDISANVKGQMPIPGVTWVISR